MAFINKKEEVIKLRLTQKGKHLLSRGMFRPECYAFFDDDIVYDVRYTGISEHQNDAQTRIKDTARRDAQHLTTGVETRYEQDTDNIEIIDSTLRGEFDSLIYPVREVNEGKSLGYPLANMSLGTQEVPRYDLNVFESEIENSSSLRYETLHGARIRIPQLDFEPEHVLVRDSTAVNILAPQGQLVDNESFQINPMANKIEFMDGTFLQHISESVAISLEEFNVPYLSKNFEIEIFEIVTEENQNEVLVPIRQWSTMFEIKLDDQVTSVPKKNKQRNSFF